jgi:hypothetical protein
MICSKNTHFDYQPVTSQQLYFLLYAYLGTHICFNRINDKIRKIDMPWHDEVFVFVNEHDCEQLNVFVL